MTASTQWSSFFFFEQLVQVVVTDNNNDAAKCKILLTIAFNKVCEDKAEYLFKKKIQPQIAFITFFVLVCMQNKIDIW